MKYLRSLGMSDKEILDGKGEFALLYRSPESFTESFTEKFRAMFLKEFYQKNTVAFV